jgi:AcrR family transcriptional regulator
LRDDPEARREQIIDEAIRVVGERGYYGVTIQDLAQRCGLSNAGLLYHFGTKEQLLLEMLETFERREAAAIQPLAALADGEATEASARALLDLMHTMVVRAATHPEIGRLYMVLQSETLDPSHPGHASFRAREASVLSFFRKLAAPYVSDPHSTARQLLALMDGLSLQWVREGQAFDLAAEWDRAVQTVMPGALHSATRGVKRRAPLRRATAARR